ncbi:MAG: tetratricopeptide repeat protein [Acidobacteriota bacterium]
MLAAGTIFLFTAPAIVAQTEDTRQASGLSIPFEGPAIFGKVSIEGVRQGDRLPTVYVYLFVSGSQMARQQLNDDGYYYFLTSPRNGATLIFEANGIEVGRTILGLGQGNTARPDITLNFGNVSKRSSQPLTDVVSVKDAYVRSAEAEKSMDKALQAISDNKAPLAISLLEELVAKDPKDFVAWTELGSLYFSYKKLDKAESAYSAATAANPTFFLAQINLGKLSHSQKSYDKAIPCFIAAARIDEKSADAFHFLGESFLQVKQGNNAVIALNEAIRLSPIEKAEIHLRLAALYDAAGAKDRAAAEYKTFLEKRPDYSDRKKLQSYITDNLK